MNKKFGNSLVTAVTLCQESDLFQEQIKVITSTLNTLVFSGKRGVSHIIFSICLHLQLLHLPGLLKNKNVSLKR